MPSKPRSKRTVEKEEVGRRKGIRKVHLLAGCFFFDFPTGLTDPAATSTSHSQVSYKVRGYPSHPPILHKNINPCVVGVGNNFNNSWRFGYFLHLPGRTTCFCRASARGRSEVWPTTRCLYSGSLDGPKGKVKRLKVRPGYCMIWSRGYLRTGSPSHTWRFLPPLAFFCLWGF